MMMTLANTAPLMSNDNYKTRFFAEYAQTKIRYEKLKHLCDEIEAARMSPEPASEPPHDCPLELLRQQQHAMGEYLHCLELRAVIERVDLDMMEA